MWMHFSIWGARHESKLHENINAFNQKYVSVSFLRLGLREFLHVGNGRCCCDERRQSQINQRSRFHEKVTCVKLNDLHRLLSGQEYWYTQTYDAGPFRVGTTTQTLHNSSTFIWIVAKHFPHWPHNYLCITTLLQLFSVIELVFNVYVPIYLSGVHKSGNQYHPLLINGVATWTKVPNKDTFIDCCANWICWTSMCCNIISQYSQKCMLYNGCSSCVRKSVELIFNLQPQNFKHFFLDSRFQWLSELCGWIHIWTLSLHGR